MKKELRQRVYAKYENKCGYCGYSINYSDMQVDHIIPQNEFISHIKNQFRIPAFLTHLKIEDVNNFDNLMPTCRVCNNWKGAHTLEGFRKEISEQIERLNNYSSNYRMAKKYNLISEHPKQVIFFFEQTIPEQLN